MLSQYKPLFTARDCEEPESAPIDICIDLQRGSLWVYPPLAKAPERAPDATKQLGFTPGIYEHFKGGLYRALLVARHIENLEFYVVYASKQDGQVWVRSYKSWTEIVLPSNGVTRPRFLSTENEYNQGYE